MASDTSYEALLKETLDQVIRDNRQMRSGTPMADLAAAIETAINALPPLEFEEYSKAIDNTDAAEELIRNAPELIGWNEDQIVQWIEELAKRISP